VVDLRPALGANVVPLRRKSEETVSEDLDIYFGLAKEGHI